MIIDHSSSESEEEVSGQPKPPHRKRGYVIRCFYCSLLIIGSRMEKKKRKRDQIIDSDASGEERRTTRESRCLIGVTQSADDYRSRITFF